MKSSPHTRITICYGLQALRNFESSNFLTTVFSLFSLKLLEISYLISLALAVLKGKNVFDFKINTSPKGNIPISLVSTLMMKFTASYILI